MKNGVTGFAQGSDGEFIYLFMDFEVHEKSFEDLFRLAAHWFNTYVDVTRVAVQYNGEEYSIHCVSK